nr:hypothetical protein GCM10020093_003150 [Planobispora longispora]
MRAARHPALRGILLEPVTEEVMEAHGRLVTVWPTGVPVDHDAPEAAPWEAGARLLARMHAVHPEALPAPRLGRAPAGGRGRRPDEGRFGGRARRAPRLRLPARPRLRPRDRRRPRLLAHGDWHMGQMVRHGGEWILIDADDMGVGDPAWDLARPAAWFAAGLLDPQAWHRFLGPTAPRAGARSRRTATRGSGWRSRPRR